MIDLGLTGTLSRLNYNPFLSDWHDVSTKYFASLKLLWAVLPPQEHLIKNSANTEGKDMDCGRKKLQLQIQSKPK